ncbi:MAG: PAS-domain containing protein [Brevundimonas sp.]|uniref:hybrid sensor histidine kinase/response regulator n=1 Tax=Brevundimonas sp. TaxID=1871086 RepID=UPI002735BD50|nr:PAS-domain containing protein [Brevundimonas sp.]MDP3404162.1 PAS-domain containing protein [Brevundimonas sp.]
MTAMFASLILMLVAAYMALLFAVAGRSERPGRAVQGPRPWAYALSLAIYCTSWTYYGAVGTATRDGWDYLPIYLGPVIGLVLLFPLWRRITAAAKRENIGSIADFISSRYGKSPALGALVACVAIFGSLPYIALQLKSLSMAWQLVTAGTAVAGSEHVTVSVIAAVLAGFTILFGARRADLTEHNRGLIHAVALESVIKLAALLAVAVFAALLLLGLPDRGAIVASLGDLAVPPVIDARFITITLLATLAIFCLPRQFHVGFVEAVGPADIRRARWAFPAYLLLTSLAVLPIVAAGRLFAGVGDPDLFVLGLPFQQGAQVLTAIVFVGGFSAATAMVIVETVALSAMASNSLILPLLARDRWRAREDASDMAEAILLVRRIVICIILFLALLYFQAIDRSSGLASIGLTSFAALAQLAPALFGAVIWRGGHASGAFAGLMVGSVIWLVFLALPQIGTAFGMGPIHPFGLEDPLPLGVLLSLGANTLVFVLVSRAARPRLIDRVQARAFVDRISPDWRDQSTAPSGASVGDLRTLVARFVGDAGAARAFAAFAGETGQPLRDGDPADAGLARAAERMLAGAVGASSARRVIAAALAGGGRAPEDVVRMLDEASEAVQFNRELLQTTLDNIDQGVSVVDEDLRLIAWNARYIALFDLPVGFIHVGLPVAAVYRLNAERGEVEAADMEAWVERRLEALRRRTPHDHERTQPNGRILRSTGVPMAGGGYVTSYTDITALRRAAEALKEANEQLEARVADRTERLNEARQTAEDAVASKTRFLAAASHDLLQPLHAARLFIAALKDGADTAGAVDTRELAENADRSIESAHGLLKALLNLSRLEAGGVKPTVVPLSLETLFADLRREFVPLAAARGLRLGIAPSGLWVASDRDLLRSLLQNLIGNAIRYTDRGGVLVGARRSGGMIKIEVHDTGRGIPVGQQELVFSEFTRLPGKGGDEPGAGLGLAIVRRVADLLEHPLSLRSLPGRGTTFVIAAPRAAPIVRSADDVPAGTAGSRLDVAGLRVLCVDNEPVILDALVALLGRWGMAVVTAPDADSALALPGPFDAALIDLHLGEGEDGLSLAAALRARGLAHIGLITADGDETLPGRAAAAGVVLMAKPVRPAALKAFLSRRQGAE